LAAGAEPGDYLATLDDVSPVADRLLRLMVMTRAPVSEYNLDSLAMLEDEPAPVRLRVEAGKGGWKAEPVAA
jgi:hypothetical protein